VRAERIKLIKAWCARNRRVNFFSPLWSDVSYHSLRLAIVYGWAQVVGSAEFRMLFVRVGGRGLSLLPSSRDRLNEILFLHMHEYLGQYRYVCVRNPADKLLWSFQEMRQNMSIWRYEQRKRDCVGNILENWLNVVKLLYGAASGSVKIFHPQHMTQCTTHVGRVIVLPLIFLHGPPSSLTWPLSMAVAFAVIPK